MRANPRAPQVNEELEDALGYDLGALVRWGNVAIIALISVAVVAASLVPYPEVVRGQAKLASTRRPLRLPVPQSAELEQLLAVDGQDLAAGDPLMILRSSATYRDVMQIRSWLAASETLKVTPSNDPPPAQLNLGTMQDAYGGLLASFKDAANDSVSRILCRKPAILASEVVSRRRVDEIYQQSKKLHDDRVTLARRLYDRSRDLFAAEGLPPVELDHALEQYLDARVSGEEFDVAAEMNRIAIAEAEGSLLDSRLRCAERGAELGARLTHAVQKLKGELLAWQALYEVRAPVNGRVAIIEQGAVGERNLPSAPTVAIIPGGGEVEGSMYLPTASLARLSRGQSVLVEVNGFPPIQHGTLRGIVTEIAAVPADGQYLVKFSLPDGLRSSYGVTFPFRQNMEGVAKIVVRKASLLNRFAGMFGRTRAKRGGLAL